MLWKYVFCGSKRNFTRINEEMDIGSVRAPLTPFIESDFESIRRAASLIQLTKKRKIY